MSEGKYIKWGEGGFGAGDWKILYDFIQTREVKTVLEYGCGVTTELMMAVGLKVLSLETQQKYADIPGANILVFPYGEYPDGLGVYDLAFIDGPGAYEFESTGLKPERKLSAMHAKRHANAVYMHDAHLGQNEVFDSDCRWKKVRDGDSNLIYEKI